MADIAVFLSSTSDDLQDERGAIADGIRRMGWSPVGMEDFGSDTRAPAEVCCEKLKGCSVYVGVVGFRYGSLVPGSERSFTELEYGIASDMGIPRVIYLRSKGAPVPACHVDVGDDRRRVDGFRSRLERAHTVSYFQHHHELAAHVVADLHRLSRAEWGRTRLAGDIDGLGAPGVRGPYVRPPR
jgi:hypothetical protein